MIEQTMQELKDEMAELRSAIAGLTAAMQAAPAQQVEKKTKAEKPSLDTKAETEPAEVAISREDLQDLCMTIVRNDRSKKADVKAAIASFGGASTLKAVADSDLAALKAALEGLQ